MALAAAEGATALEDTLKAAPAWAADLEEAQASAAGLAAEQAE